MLGCSMKINFHSFTRMNFSREMYENYEKIRSRSRRGMKKVIAKSQWHKIGMLITAKRARNCSHQASSIKLMANFTQVVSLLLCYIME